jgi:hypothetical protein
MMLSADCEDDAMTEVVVNLVRDDQENVTGVQLGFLDAAASVIRLN